MSHITLIEAMIGLMDEEFGAELYVHVYNVFHTKDKQHLLNMHRALTEKEPTVDPERLAAELGDAWTVRLQLVRPN